MKEKRIRYNLKKSPDLNEGKILSQKTFDKNNNLISEISYSNFGDDITDNWIYKYSNGHLVEKKWNSDGPKAQRFIYEYDVQGTLIKELWYNKPVLFGIGYEDGSPIIKDYIYNSEGLLIKKISDHRDVGFYDHWTFEYDCDNNLIREIGYKSSGEIQHENRFEYDDNNNLVTREEFYKGKVNNKFSFEYNDQNQKVAMKEHHQMMKKYIYEYDNGKLSSEYIYEYGQNNPGTVVRIIKE